MYAVNFLPVPQHPLHVIAALDMLVSTLSEPVVSPCSRIGSSCASWLNMDGKLDPEVWGQLPSVCRNRILAHLPWLKLCVVTGRHKTVSTVRKPETYEDRTWLDCKVRSRRFEADFISQDPPGDYSYNPRVWLVPAKALTKASHRARL